MQIEITYNLKYIDQNTIKQDIQRRDRRMISAFLEKIKQAYSWFILESHQTFETLRL
jgi:hypothetical protein